MLIAEQTGLFDIWVEMPASGQAPPIGRAPARRTESEIEASDRLNLERAISIASEMHPDHWPRWLVDLAERISAGQAWVVKTHPRGGEDYEETTQLALALVGRDPYDRPLGPRQNECRPCDRRAFEAEVKRVRSLRDAIVEAGQSC